MKCLLPLVAAAALLSACHDGPTAAAVPVVTVRDSTPLFQTDSLVYTLARRGLTLDATIGLALRNRTGGPAYLLTCWDEANAALERLDGDSWVPVWHDIIGACPGYLVVAEGGEARYTQRIFGGLPESNVGSRFLVDPPSGVYRLVFPRVLRSFQPQLTLGESLPVEARTSNRFTLVVPSR